MIVVAEFLGGYVTSTAGTYAHVLHDAAAYLRVPLAEASRSDLSGYLASLDGMAPGTVRRYLSTLGAFYSWLVLTGQRGDNPIAGLRRPRVDPLRAIHPLTSDQMLLLIEASRDDRERALLWVLAHGLRLAEVVSLDVDSITGDELRFTGKGSKDRIVPLEPDAARAVLAYRGRRRSGPLFMGREGRLSRRQVQRIVGDVSRRIGDESHPHRLRHSFATSLVKSGTSTLVLQRLMGHASASSSAIYAHLSVQDLRGELHRSPLAKRARDQRFAVLDGENEMPGHGEGVAQ